MLSLVNHDTVLHYVNYDSEVQNALQNYRPSNFVNDWSGPGIEPRPNVIAHNSGGMAEAADFFLRTPTLTASNFAAL